MKNLLLSVAFVATLGAFLVVPSKNAEAAPSFDCKWKEAECPYGEVVYYCIATGDGNLCDDCGATVFPCDDDPEVQ